MNKTVVQNMENQWSGKESFMKQAKTSYIAYGLILVVVAVSFFSRIWDPDFFWHLATGRWIVEHGTWPVNDPFGTYADASSESAQQILKGYWLCQILYYGIFSNFGYVGLAALKSLSFMFLFVGQLWLFRKKEIGIALVAVQSVIVYSELLSFRADRPQMFSYLGAMLVLMLIELRLYRWLPLVMLVWANMHGGYLVGVLIIVIHAMIAIYRWYRKQTDAPSSITWYLAAIAFAGINPNFFRAFKFVINMQAGEHQKTIYEYISPLTLAYRDHEIYWGYFLILFLGIVLLIALRKKIPSEQAMVFLCLSVFSLTASRYMPFLIICGSIYIVLWLSPICGQLGRSFLIASGVLVLMGMIFISDVRNGRGFSYGVEKGRYPEKALAFIDSAGIKGNLFCSDYWGGYVLLNSPGRYGSCDTRCLSAAENLRNLSILYKSDLFDEFTSSYVDIVLTSAFNLISGEKYLLWQLLSRSPFWRLAYADEIALVFVKNNSAVQGQIDPLSKIFDHSLKQAMYFTGKYPDTVFHWMNLSDIYVMRRELALAGMALRKVQELNPGDPEINSQIMFMDRAITYSKR